MVGTISAAKKLCAGLCFEAAIVAEAQAMYNISRIHHMHTVQQSLPCSERTHSFSTRTLALHNSRGYISHYRSVPNLVCL